MKQGRARAHSLKELDEILGMIDSDESYARGKAFKPRPSDIIISPYAKSGTTWLQHITHGLRTRGSMDFDEITAVTPWLESAYDLGWDLDAEQVAQPRLFKSHLNWHDVPKGARYIYAFRHPYDALVSLYRFFEGWFFEAGCIELADFAYWRYPRAEMQEKGYWHHIASWWEQQNNNDVLLLCYEDMKADLPDTIRKLAAFMHIELDDDLFETLLRQSSRDFMLEHKHHFDERYSRRLAHERAGLPLVSEAHKITAGAPNDSRYQLPESIKTMLDELWQEHIETRFGFKTYGEMRQALKTL